MRATDSSPLSTRTTGFAYEKMMAEDRSYLEKTVEIFLDDLFRVLRSGVRAYRNGVLIRVFFNVLGEAEKRVML